MALTESDLSDLLAALKTGEFTDTIRSSLEWILQQLIESEATYTASRDSIYFRLARTDLPVWMELSRVL